MPFCQILPFLKLEPRQWRPTQCFNEIMANLRFQGHVTEIFKSCNFISNKPIRFENLLRFALSLTVSEIMANWGFRGNVTFRVSCDLKIDIFKSCNFVSSKPTGLTNLLCFAYSFRDNGQETFPRSCDLKIEIFKSCNWQ